MERGDAGGDDTAYPTVAGQFVMCHMHVNSQIPTTIRSSASSTLLPSHNHDTPQPPPPSPALPLHACHFSRSELENKVPKTEFQNRHPHLIPTSLLLLISPQGAKSEKRFLVSVFSLESSMMAQWKEETQETTMPHTRPSQGNL